MTAKPQQTPGPFKCADPECPGETFKASDIPHRHGKTRHVLESHLAADLDKCKRVKAALLAALEEIANPEDGECPRCGLQDFPDCPITIARAAIARAKGEKS